MTKDGRLDAAVRAWRAETDRLPEHLRDVPHRVRRAARSTRSATGRRPARARTLALVASLLLGALMLGSLLRGTGSPAVSGRDIVGGQELAALSEVERDHARRAEHLEPRARARLAEARDADLSAARAATLLAQKERLESLEQTIERSERFLEMNPYHAAARLTLLRARETRHALLSSIVRGEGAAS